MIRMFLLMAFGIAFIIWGASVFWKLSAESDSDIVAGLASDAISKIEDFTGTTVSSLTTSQSSLDETPVDLRIAATGGTGVALRSDCLDGARSGGALAEGSLVALEEAGADRCLGWSLVSYERVPDGAAMTTWVRQEYLEALSTP